MSDGVGAGLASLRMGKLYVEAVLLNEVGLEEVIGVTTFILLLPLLLLFTIDEFLVSAWLFIAAFD
jgi:hypothetical protein